jgi:hypothetical protein
LSGAATVDGPTPAEPGRGAVNASSFAARDRVAVTAALCLGLVGLGAVLREIVGLRFAALAALPLLAAYFVLCWRELRSGSRVLIALTLAISAWAAFLVSPAVFATAIDRAIYFSAFLALLGLLREAAAASPLVGRAGRFLIAQPPGRRYVALTTGGHLFGILLSLGGYALLLDMLRRANTLEAAAGRPEVVALRERRMTMAIMRGFTVMPFWSPLSVSMALVLASMPQVSWFELAPIGIAATVAFMALGWLFDRIQSRPARVGLMATPEPGGFAAFLAVTGHVIALAAATVAVELMTQLPFQKVLLIVVPIYAFGWMWAQTSGRGRGERTVAAARALAAGAGANYPRYANEVTIFATSAFLGVVLAALVPPGLLDRLVAGFALSPALAAPALCLAAALLAIAGFNPMITVAIFATALSSQPIPGLSPREMAFTLCGAWAISVGIGPFISTTVMTSGILGKPLTTVCWRWNGPFGFTALALFCLVLYVVEL